MLYTIKEYQAAFHPTKTIRTVRRMVSSNLLPPNHYKVLISKRIVFVETTPNVKYECYLKAIKDYCKQKNLQVDLELSTQCGIKNNVDSIRMLNEILGYKE